MALGLGLVFLLVRSCPKSSLCLSLFSLSSDTDLDSPLNQGSAVLFGVAA
jgi:hypothetical protein